jgi:hypothetical protein
VRAVARVLRSVYDVGAWFGERYGDGRTPGRVAPTVKRNQIRRMMNVDMYPTSQSSNKPIATSVNETFDKRPFTLSAVAMRKINDIIVSRLPGKLLFDVGYSDGTQFSALDLESVLGDDNPKRRSIKRIECYFGSGSGTTFDFSRRMHDSDGLQLTFDADGESWESPISLRVSSPDRERVWLTIAELRDYVSSEVATRSRFPNWVRIAGLACATAACCWGLVSWGRTFVSPPLHLPNLAEVMQSPDPNIKLNYLLLQSSSNSARFPLPIVMAIFIVFGVGLVAVMKGAVDGVTLPESLFPRNHFTIGRGAERYDKQRRLRSKLFWSVFVSLVVSVVGGVLLLVFTKP